MIYTKQMTEGSELSHILRFTLPLLAGNLFQQLYNIVDSVIVGKFLGYHALAAVGATGSITYLFYTLCIGLAAGAGILIAQTFGAGKEDDVKRLIANSAYAISAFGIVISVLSVILAPFLLRLLDTPENVFDAAVAYMRISCAGTLAVAAYNWINAVMRSLGDARTPLIFLIVASLVNVGLDLLFVVVFHWGVNGAAWATIIAQGISAIGSITYACFRNPCFRLTKGHIMPNRSVISRCVKTGVPIALQNAMISVSMVFLQKTANRFGDTVMAAYTATMRVEQLIQQPFASLNTAVSTFAGQNIGAGKIERAIRGYRQSMKVTSIFAVVMFLVFWVFSRPIVGCFVENPNVIAIGGNALKLSACFYLFLGTIHTTRGLLNGAGDVTYALINGIVEVIGRVGFALLLVQIPVIGHWAVWGTTCLTWLLTALMSLIRYHGGKWKRGFSEECIG